MSNFKFSSYPLAKFVGENALFGNDIDQEVAFVNLIRANQCFSLSRHP